jgi:hypothetical protein
MPPADHDHQGEPLRTKRDTAPLAAADRRLLINSSGANGREVGHARSQSTALDSAGDRGPGVEIALPGSALELLRIVREVRAPAIDTTVIRARSCIP